MTISLLRYGRVFLYDLEGHCVGAYRQEDVDRKLIDYLKQQPVRRPYHRDSYQSIRVPVQALAISETFLHYRWPNVVTYIPIQLTSVS